MRDYRTANKTIKILKARRLLVQNKLKMVRKVEAAWPLKPLFVILEAIVILFITICTVIDDVDAKFEAIKPHSNLVFDDKKCQGANQGDSQFGIILLNCAINAVGSDVLGGCKHTLVLSLFLVPVYMLLQWLSRAI